MNIRKKFKSISGFTLLELIIVMSILGVLATVFVTSYPASQRRARDSVRMTDLNQYKVALEVFANRNNGNYPNSSGADWALHANDLCVNSLDFAAGQCPQDPRSGDSVCSSTVCEYMYRSSGARYIMWSAMEAPANPGNHLHIICSNGRTGFVASFPAGDVCPI